MINIRTSRSGGNGERHWTSFNSPQSSNSPLLTCDSIQRYRTMRKRFILSSFFYYPQKNHNRNNNLSSNFNKNHRDRDNKKKLKRRGIGIFNLKSDLDFYFARPGLQTKKNNNENQTEEKIKGERTLTEHRYYYKCRILFNFITFLYIWIVCIVCLHLSLL